MLIECRSPLLDAPEASLHTHLILLMATPVTLVTHCKCFTYDEMNQMVSHHDNEALRRPVYCQNRNNNILQRQTVECNRGRSLLVRMQVGQVNSGFGLCPLASQA